MGEWGERLVEVFSEVPDPRRRRGIRHPLPAILTMAVCAMLRGARSLYAIAQWGREHPELTQTLGFDREKTPCVATLHYLFRKLDVEAFEDALSRWANEALTEGDQAVAIDGKALRGIHGEEIPGVRLVAAYALEASLVVEQFPVKAVRVTTKKPHPPIRGSKTDHAAV